jgi:hypothetical protein
MHPHILPLVKMKLGRMETCNTPIVELSGSMERYLQLKPSKHTVEGEWKLLFVPGRSVPWFVKLIVFLLFSLQKRAEI